MYKEGREPTCFSSATDDEVGGDQARSPPAMFAPPICRRRWRNNAFRSVGSDEDGGNPANIAASGASHRTLRAQASGTIRHWRIARRRAEEEGADMLFVGD